MWILDEQIKSVLYDALYIYIYVLLDPLHTTIQVSQSSFLRSVSNTCCASHALEKACKNDQSCWHNHYGKAVAAKNQHLKVHAAAP